MGGVSTGRICYEHGYPVKFFLYMLKTCASYSNCQTTQYIYILQIKLCYSCDLIPCSKYVTGSCYVWYTPGVGTVLYFGQFETGSLSGHPVS